MRLKAILSVLTLTMSVALAEEKAVEGGKSPDGKYEVRISREGSENTSYGVHIVRLRSDKRIFTIPDLGGYLGFQGAVERDNAWWHASSRFVAITDQGSRHSRELYVAAIDGDQVSLLKQPDFYQNALGQIGAVEIDFADVVNSKKWDGDDLVLELYFTANHRRSYTFEVTLHLSHGANTTPWLSLKSVKKLKEEEG